jgi:hypothetical protein
MSYKPRIEVRKGNFIQKDEDFSYVKSDLSMSKLYREIELDEYQDKNADSSSLFYSDQSWRHQLFLIDDFVKLALANNKQHIKITKKRNGALSVYMSRFAKFFFPILFKDHYFSSSEYLFSENVELFLKCFKEMGLPLPEKAGPIAQIKDFCIPKPYFFPEESLCGDIFNRLVELIREGGNDPVFKKRVKDRERSALANYETCLNYVAELFADWARLLVLRVDVHYDREKVTGELSPTQARKDLNRLLNNRRHNSLFDALVGYIWKLESARQRGLHFHLVLFFDGSRAKQHVYLAEEIGKYWVDTITKGAGTYHSCHRDPSKYRRSGIGMIHHTDTEKIATLDVILKYITKVDQYLRLKGGRSFGHGVVPKRGTDKKMGRPRTKNIFDELPWVVGKQTV